jgi:hypothetical protein
MLQKLAIKNYALIDNLEISFDKGLNILTGETGAGKFIILAVFSFSIISRITPCRCGVICLQVLFIGSQRFFQQTRQTATLYNLLKSKTLLFSAKEKTTFLNQVPYNSGIDQDTLFVFVFELFLDVIKIRLDIFIVGLRSLQGTRHCGFLLKD